MKSLLSLVRSAKRQVRPYQGLRLLPDLGITFNLRMSLHEDAVIPGVFIAVIGACFVVKSKVPEDRRARGISSLNFGLAMN